MDKFPLMQGGVSVGELITEQEALYTWFEARCRLPGEGLWCAWAVGDRGELRLGVLEPCGDRATIRRRFSASGKAAAGGDPPCPSAGAGGLDAAGALGSASPFPMASGAAAPCAGRPCPGGAGAARAGGAL